MKIFEKDIKETFGCLLMHSVFLKDGRIRKGKILDKNDIAMMERSDIEKVQVGEMEDGDIGENAASSLIALSKGKYLVNFLKITLSLPYFFSNFFTRKDSL